MREGGRALPRHGEINRLFDHASLLTGRSEEMFSTAVNEMPQPASSGDAIARSLSSRPNLA